MTLPQGGVLAVQMPDNVMEPSHVLMQEAAGRGRGRKARARRCLSPSRLLCEAQAVVPAAGHLAQHL